MDGYLFLVLMSYLVSKCLAFVFLKFKLVHNLDRNSRVPVADIGQEGTSVDRASLPEMVGVLLSS